jgi:hypothetical protein
MIVYISTKLLLIGIIKNYNRCDFILAVISFAPLSANIVSRGLPKRKEEVLRAFGEDREAWNNNRARPPCRNRIEVRSREWSPVSTASEEPASSYSLYATHAPLVFFVWAAVGGLFRRDWFKELPTPLHWIIAFALMAVAYGFSRLTEVRAKELRGTLRLGLHIVHKPPCGIVGVPHQHPRATEEKVLGHVALQDFRSVPSPQYSNRNFSNSSVARI